MHKLPDCSATRVAVSPQGVPWVIDSQNQVLMYTSGTWQSKQGLASDIGIGADGSVFAVSTVLYSQTGGNTILKWNGSAWNTMTDCSGTHIAVSPAGIPWVANLSNVVYQFSGNVLWNQVPGVQANNIAIGANGAIYVTGIGSGDVPVYQYVSGNWSPVAGISATSIAAGPDGKLWWIDASGSLNKQ